MWEVRERKKQQPRSRRHPPGDWGAPTSVATMFLPLPSPMVDVEQCVCGASGSTPPPRVLGGTDGTGLT
jgi:hypothetical protein